MTDATSGATLRARLVAWWRAQGELRVDDDITGLIRDAARGEPGSEERLLALIYHDLLRLARSKLARERTYTDLNANALVHEAWLRFSSSIPQDVPSRRVFFSYAARAMESVIIDHVRQRQAQKRGEGVAEVTLPTGFEGQPEPHTDEQIEHLHAAMQRLERIDPELHELVRLRYFAGLTIEQVAELLEASPATIKRRWSQARTILRSEMEGGGSVG
jgi:RNA polymerase sigma factor (TIGR02999 family)